MILRGGAIAGALCVLTACPGPGGPNGAGKGSNIEITDVATHADAAVEAKGDDAPPVQPGSEGDVIGRVFTLGAEPSVPSGFGKLKPFVTRAEGAKLRPTDWGNAWSRTPSSEAVTFSAGDPEGSDDPIGHLDVTLDQAGAAWRLEQAWGAPPLRAYDGSSSCWLSATAKLKACHTKQLGHDVIELGAFVTLDFALGKSGGRHLAALVARIGQAKADVERAFPQHETILDETDPTKNRIEVAFPSTEYMASAHPDRVLLYLDAKDRVHTIAVRFGANDPAQRPALVERVKAVADELASTKDAPSVTVLEGEPLDVVVVLDRAGALE